MDDRQALLQNWVNQTLSNMSLAEPQGTLLTVSGDASFRRYFRQPVNQGSYIAVDAPPDKENSASFVNIAKEWFSQGVKVPEIIHSDLEKGFMLLSDMGDQMLYPLLEDGQAEVYYPKALDSLIGIQQTQSNLPLYDAPLLDREMALFTDWYLAEHLKFNVSQNDQFMLTETFELLRESALGQVQVPVHRDYHSRNIMVLDDNALGIIDFQDGVMGPITYDLASLLRDAYIAWPQEQVEDWARLYFEKARSADLIGALSDDQLMLWFDWMGLQRHIKVVGIFARLSIRDGKTAYMDDIPRTFKYIRQVSAKYDALIPFNQWIEMTLVPFLQENGHEVLALDEQQQQQEQASEAEA
jgi:aminoglycoside/choline kinase family phosphotransferase